MSKAPPPAQRLPLWLRALSRLPLGLHYALATCLAACARHVLRYRLTVVRTNLAGAFPDLPSRARRAIERAYYRNLADLFAEIVKSATLSPAQLNARVTLKNLALVRAELAASRPVLIVAAHQCNWEWLLLALSLQLGYPLDAAYKPLHDVNSERVMRAIRSRFGSRLVPAKALLAHILEHREVRALTMVADQEPVSSDHKWWTQFLNRPSAFYMGPEKIAQVTRFAVVFAGMRRIARGRYEVDFQLLQAAQRPFEPGTVTERYARLVEAQIRAAPADWTWSHQRWKLKRPMYSTMGNAR